MIPPLLYVWGDDELVSTEPATFPPCPAAMSTMTLPAFIEATSSAVMSFGAGRPGMSPAAASLARLVIVAWLVVLSIL